MAHARKPDPFGEKFYPETKFGGFTDCDGIIAFFNRVNALLQPEYIVLDVGCGRGSYGDDPVRYRKNLRIIRGKVARIIGIDVDENACANAFIDEFRLIRDDCWPVDSNSIDLLICDNVLEHIEQPERFFAEIRRVLKDGGILCLRTPNKWCYIVLAAMCIPEKFHSAVLSLAQSGREQRDVFPAYYRCNSVRKLRGIMTRYGFDCVVYGYEAEPNYLSFSIITYFFGVLHQLFAPGWMKPSIFAFGLMQKKKESR
ncbi:MAG: methyltransferase domain-containing protein [Desulfocapsaceae bacterium]|nr:methyltransferase domain-containing protein [Desulfocapsaceae bacterium]